jgi:hypothetical protein
MWGGRPGGAALRPPRLLDRVEWVIQQALGRGMALVIDNHLYPELMADPATHRDRLLAIVAQLAGRFRGAPDGVLPEVLNEPQASLDPVWNAYLAELLAVGGRTSSAASLPPASSSLRSWLRRGTGRSSWASSVPPTTPTWHHGPVGHAPTGSSPNVTGSPGATGRSVPASRSTTSTPTAGTGATRRTQHLKGLGVT